MIKKSFRYTSIILLIFLVSACNSGSLFLGRGLSPELPVESLQDASTLGPESEIPVTIDDQAITGQIDLVLFSLEDSLGRIVYETRYEGEQLTFPYLQPLVLENLANDTYRLRIELFENGESLGRHERWFYFSNAYLELSQISLNPHSAESGEEVQVGIDVIGDSSRTPYVQLRMNGAVVYEGSIDDNSLQFVLTAPDSPGIYDLRLDLYPWFDNRIDEAVFSSSNQTLELLVTDDSSASETGEQTFEAQPGLQVEGDLFQYNNDRLATRLVLDVESARELETGELVSLSAGFNRIGLQLVQNALEVSVETVSSDVSLAIPVDNSLFEQAVSIDVLEGESHITLLASSGDRLLAGDIINFNRADTDSEEFDNGLQVSSPGIDTITIKSLFTDNEPDSLFKLILQLKYGNFVLYGEGFEFASAVNSSISYSDEAFIRNGYLVLPPGAWVELPDFALDEYLVEIESRFHPGDDLSDSSIVLLKGSGDDFSEIFTLNGSGLLSASQVPLARDIQLGSTVMFELSRETSSLRLGLLDGEYFLPVSGEGRYRFLISQDAQADVRIRLDSVSAANAPDEFVDKVLNTLP